MVYPNNSSFPQVPGFATLFFRFLPRTRRPSLRQLPEQQSSFVLQAPSLGVHNPHGMLQVSGHFWWNSIFLHFELSAPTKMPFSVPTHWQSFSPILPSTAKVEGQSLHSPELTGARVRVWLGEAVGT